MKYVESIRNINQGKMPESSQEAREMTIEYFRGLDEYREYELNTKGELVECSKVKLPSFKEYQVFMGLTESKFNQLKFSKNAEEREIAKVVEETEEFIHGTLESGLINKDRYCKGVEVMLKSRYKDMYSVESSEDVQKTVVNVVFKNQEVKEQFDKLSEL